MRKTFIKTLSECVAENPDVFLVTGDVGYGVLKSFTENFPKQFLNIGIAEQNMTGIATGLALEGKIVFTYSIANFPTLRCLEQIRNDAAYHAANVNIVSVGGGFSYGAAGMSHHATEDLAIMRSLPIVVVAPGDLWEVEQATRALINHSGTCYFRLDHSYADISHKKDEKFILGKARRILEGDAITIMAIGGILNTALQVANQLREEANINCRVVSMHTLNPLDTEEIFDAAENTGGIVTVEEHTVSGGLGSSVAEVCLENGIVPKVFYRFGLREGFSQVVGDQEYLKNYYNISAKAIIPKLKELIK
ncbi:MAG: transketolase C-terminal domain-containing protein [Gammaproteobacteria bacterium]